jgi:hypothetical protein
MSPNQYSAGQISAGFIDVSVRIQLMPLHPVAVDKSFGHGACEEALQKTVPTLIFPGG